MVLALALALGIGLATAAQSPTNGSLGSIVGPIQASLVSFSGGLLIMSVLCFFAGTGDITQALTVPWWMLLGGVYGDYIVFVMATCTHNLGVALSLTLIMLGQLTGGMLIDTFGLMESKVVEVSLLRGLGCLLVLAGIILVYIDRVRDQKSDGQDQAKEKKEMKTLVLQTVLVFSAGLASAIQAPANAGLGAAAGTMEASVVSFVGGWFILLIATLIANKGKLNSFKGVRLWQLTGGIYGAFGVPSLVIATPILGVSLVMGGSMVGQLVGGMVVDALGAFRVKKRRVNALRIAGAAVLFMGVVLVTMGS